MTEGAMRLKVQVSFGARRWTVLAALHPAGALPELQAAIVFIDLGALGAGHPTPTIGVCSV